MDKSQIRKTSGVIFITEDLIDKLGDSLNDLLEGNPNAKKDYNFIEGDKLVFIAESGYDIYRKLSSTVLSRMILHQDPFSQIVSVGETESKTMPRESKSEEAEQLSQVELAPPPPRRAAAEVETLSQDKIAQFYENIESIVHLTNLSEIQFQTLASFLISNNPDLPIILSSLNDYKIYKSLEAEGSRIPRIVWKIYDFDISHVGDIVELSEEREKYFSKICKYIKQTSGSIIIIDYGYTDSIKHFTLQAFYNHKPSNLFDNIGKQDITSFVNFKKFISLAHKFKLNIEIFCSQKEFLQANGILERKNKIVKKCSNVQKKNLELGYKKLIDEQQMGSVYKFLIVSSKKKYEKL